MKDEILGIEENQTVTEAMLIKEEKEEFMIFVQGGNAPSVVHETWESAEKEAIRLAGLPNNRHQKVFVVKVVDVLVPVFSHKWSKSDD